MNLYYEVADFRTQNHNEYFSHYEAHSSTSASPEAPRLLHARRRHVLKVQLLDAAELVDAHCAVQRAHCLLVCALRKVLGLNQCFNVIWTDWPTAARSLSISPTRAQVENQLPPGGFQANLLDLLRRAPLIGGSARLLVADLAF
eukprot:7357931-Prymnesium_polylepis.1